MYPTNFRERETLTAAPSAAAARTPEARHPSVEGHFFVSRVFRNVWNKHRSVRGVSTHHKLQTKLTVDSTLNCVKSDSPASHVSLRYIYAIM